MIRQVEAYVSILPSIGTLVRAVFGDFDFDSLVSANQVRVVTLLGCLSV